MKLWHRSRQSAFSTSQQHGSLSRWIDWRTALLGLWATWSWAMVPPKSAFPPEGTRPRHNKLHVETWSALFWVKKDGISKKTCPPSKSRARFGLKDDNFELGQELGGGSQGHRGTWHLWSFLSAKASFLLPVFSCFVTRAGRVFACKRLGTIIHRPRNLLHFSMINENHFEVSLDRPWLATCQHGWNCGQFLRLPLRRLGTGNEYAVKVRDNLCHCHSALHVFFCNLKPWSVSTCTGRACTAPFLCTCFIYRNFKIQTFNVEISKLMARPRLALQKIRSCWSCWFHQKWCNSHNHSHESQEFTRPTSFEIFLCRLVQVVNTKAISLRERTVASLRFADSIWRFEDSGWVFWFSADIFRMVRREIGVMRECQTQKLKTYFWMWGADIGSTYAMGKRNTETLPLVRCIIWCLYDCCLL